MKNIIVLITMMAMPVLLFSQKESVEKFCKKYKDGENTMHITLSGLGINLAAAFSDDENSKKVINKIERVRVLFTEDGNIINPQDYKSLMKEMKNDDFEELIKIRDGNSNINILFLEKGNTVTNIILTVDGDDGFILLELEGKLDWKDLQNLDIDVEGAEHFKKIPEEVIRA